MKPLEMWGGIECTYNRVGDEYIDQLEKNGHLKRPSDLKLIADLGIKKLRYPCLWEKVAPRDLDHCDWSFLDERLKRLRDLGIDPIAGFLHHGSGPLYTSLIDPEFPDKLATYARLFAQRYPWIENYTPINEILTTARFSCLYGHWYPHLTDNLYFLKSVVLQCKATVLAMREIRRINPRARLIQTDDLGKCQSTKPLEYQRNFENERRWLAYDFLSGMVDHHHPLYSWLIGCGLSVKEIEWFQENSCMPNVIGINHYHLSNRFLDHRLELYPEWTHGGNGLDRYADVGAIDTGQAELPAPEEILAEAWRRYGMPIAITEVHTRGYRESQMRWLHQVWKAAQSAREKGAEVEAVTVWSLLGTYDWHKLCTTNEYFYEPGVFDLRNPQKKPTPTALSQLVKDLATKGESDSPLLKNPGEWKTQRRVIWAPKWGAFSPLSHYQQKPLIILGTAKVLSETFARICGLRNIPYKVIGLEELDLSDSEATESFLMQLSPWGLIYTEGFSHIDQAESNKEECFRANVQIPLTLAEITAKLNIPFLTFSSDYVFDGDNDEGYVESHLPKPLNVYGESKATLENEVQKVNPQALIIRLGSVFSPWDDENFIAQTLKLLVEQREVEVPHDVRLSPIYAPDLAHECLNFLIDGEKGIIHLANDGEIRMSDLAKISAQNLRLDENLIIPRSIHEMKFTAARPKNTVLKSEKFQRLPSLDDALKRYFVEIERS